MIQSVFSIPTGVILPREVAHRPHCRWWPCSEHPCALQGCQVLVLSKPSDGAQVARVILVPVLEQRHYTTLEMKMPYLYYLGPEFPKVDYGQGSSRFCL